MTYSNRDVDISDRVATKSLSIFTFTCKDQTNTNMFTRLNTYGTYRFGTNTACNCTDVGRQYTTGQHTR